ncbi:MAG: hypothetical protein ABI723_20555 [Bacteroidia bacterium]
MRRITLTVEDHENAEMLFKMLQQLNFVRGVEFDESNEDDLSKEELQMLEDRFENYLKNSQGGKPWKEVKASLIKTHVL